jgi:16S rRNA (guanine1207-N2)-methyltransferase
VFEFETKIALANIEALARGRALLIGFEAPVIAAAPDHADLVTVLQHDLRTFRACAAYGDVYFEPWLGDTGPFDVAAIQMPKEIERLEMMLAMVRPAVVAGSSVALVGHNRAGVRAGAKALGRRVGEPALVDFRRHCRVYAASVAEGGGGGARLEDWERAFRVEIRGRAFEVRSFPGVFSHGELDPGTALLLEAVSVARGARALDVGCGAGIVAAWLASEGAHVEAVDVEALALEATRRTMAANALDGRVLASDVYSDAPGPYDMIVSNPPFHRGIRTTMAVSERVIREAPRHLARGGELWVVASRALDHRTAFEVAFDRVAVAAETGRYRVWHARRP